MRQNRVFRKSVINNLDKKRKKSHRYVLKNSTTFTVNQNLFGLLAKVVYMKVGYSFGNSVPKKIV